MKARKPQGAASPQDGRQAQKFATLQRKQDFLVQKQQVKDLFEEGSQGTDTD
ncbi:hypothetical protein V8H18_12935 [Lautropia mirabilis]